MPDLHFENKAELHKHFSTQCFNEAWKLMTKDDRTSEESDEMLHYAMASLFHWSKREDCTDKHKSIGCWQVSRCYALIGDLEQAERYGKLSLDFSKNESPYFMGYAHEALARAYHLMEITDLKNKHLDKAEELCGQVEDAEMKKLLISDLDSIR